MGVSGNSVVVVVVGTTGMGVSGLSVAAGLGVVTGRRCTCCTGAGVLAVGMKVLRGRAVTGLCLLMGAGVGADSVATRLPRLSLSKPSTLSTSYPTPAPAL